MKRCYFPPQPQLNLSIWNGQTPIWATRHIRSITMRYSTARPHCVHTGSWLYVQQHGESVSLQHRLTESFALSSILAQCVELSLRCSLYILNEVLNNSRPLLGWCWRLWRWNKSQNSVSSAKTSHYESMRKNSDIKGKEKTHLIYLRLLTRHQVICKARYYIIATLPIEINYRVNEH